MGIKVHDLIKSFPREKQEPLLVLDGIDFDVMDGEFVTLLGPSGCGKTTILKIIAGVEQPEKGEIKYDSSFYERFLPIVWQEDRLFPWRTVLKNVTFPLELRNIETAEADKRAYTLLENIDLDEFENYYPWQLSGGMAERVAIARALIAGFDYLLMDEPFASVDYQTKQTLFKLVQDLRKQQQLTIIYVTHDLRDAIQFSDRIIVLTSRPAKVKDIVMPKSSDLSHLELEDHLWNLLK